MYLKDLNVYDNLELLKVWTAVTPMTIFPNRKIGTIKEGYEANFIALAGNPIEEFNLITQINTKFKQVILLSKNLSTKFQLSNSILQTPNLL